jgi:hypothetical protein
MFEKSLRALSIATSLVVLTGWTLFAIDESRAASGQSQAQIAGFQATSRPSPTPGQERAREKAHGSLRERIDDVDDALLSPFAFLTDNSPSTWARRSVPAMVALLVYGFGLSYLARFARGRA